MLIQQAVKDVNDVINANGTDNNTFTITEQGIARNCYGKEYPCCTEEYFIENHKELINSINFERNLGNGLHNNAILSCFHIEANNNSMPYDSSTSLLA